MRCVTARGPRWCSRDRALERRASSLDGLRRSSRAAFLRGRFSRSPSPIVLQEKCANACRDWSRATMARARAWWSRRFTRIAAQFCGASVIALDCKRASPSMTRATRRTRSRRRSKRRVSPLRNGVPRVCSRKSPTPRTNSATARRISPMRMISGRARWPRRTSPMRRCLRALTPWISMICCSRSRCYSRATVRCVSSCKLAING